MPGRGSGPGRADGPSCRVRCWATGRTPRSPCYWLAGNDGWIALAPAELAPLIADAYGLTDRERRITELVAQGYPTNVIGSRLHLSAYTVQDHLKSIFDKTGTGTRGELVARLFFDHDAPRLVHRRD